MPDVEQLATFVVVSRGEIEKLKSWKQARDWHNVRMYQDLDEKYSQDFFGVDADDNDNPAMSVFTKKDGKVYQFWTAEMSGSTADPGQDPRGAPERIPTLVAPRPHPNRSPSHVVPRTQVLDKEVRGHERFGDPSPNLLFRRTDRQVTHFFCRAKVR